MPGINENVKIISVSSLNNYLKSKLEEDFYLQSILVKGEVSNLTYHSRGHLYFSLKDENSKISCVMFKISADKLTFRLEEGQKVILYGKINVYSPSGTYQINVNNIEKDGLGNLYLELEKLKEKLQKEGLFDLSRKKKIPKFPLKIGVVSAKEGAAIQDVLTTIKRRWPIAKVTLFPCLVQGKEAANSIINALKNAVISDVEVIILTRGGGSIEDLWSFNDEKLARYITTLNRPLISAIGHEVDFTIADFVSDLRAPTPTAAAEIVTPNIEEITNYLKDTKNNMVKYFNKTIETKKMTLLMNQNELDFKKYKIYLENKKLSVMSMKNNFNGYFKLFLKNNTNLVYTQKERLRLNTIYYLDRKRTNFNNIIMMLDSLSPLNVLKRGYASVKFNEKIIKSSKEIKINDIIEIGLNDGKIKAKVLEKKEKI